MLWKGWIPFSVIVYCLSGVLLPGTKTHAEYFDSSNSRVGTAKQRNAAYPGKA